MTALEPPREPVPRPSRFRVRWRFGLAVLLAAALASAAAPRPAAAMDLLGSACGLVAHAPGLGESCKLATKGLGLASRVAKKLLAGHVGGAATTVVSGVASDAASSGLAALSGWAADGARFALMETARLISATTAPRLAAPWFTRVYWRTAGIAVLLTLPFLFAAAVQALIRSDLALLVRAAFGHLPLAMLGVAVGAQITALLLAATDELCHLVSGAAGNAAPAFLGRAATAITALSLSSRSPFLAFLVAVFTVVGAIVLWMELLMRDATVYVIVVMLPLAFAALVWPARRVWTIRAVELLVALVLSKLAIVAVLTLGGAALAQSQTAAGFLVGLVLLVLGVFAPWAMLKLLPLTELASAAAGHLRSDAGNARAAGGLAVELAGGAHGWASATTARMRHDAGFGEDSAGTAAQEQLGHLRAGPVNASHEQPGAGARPSPGSPADPQAGRVTAPAAPGPNSLPGESPGSVDGMSTASSDGAGPAATRLPGGEAAAPADAGAVSPGGEVSGRETPGERLPGLSAIWQAPNFGWRTLELGPGMDSDTEPLWTPPGASEPPGASDPPAGDPAGGLEPPDRQGPEGAPE